MGVSQSAERSWPPETHRVGLSLSQTELSLQYTGRGGPACPTSSGTERKCLSRLSLDVRDSLQTLDAAQIDSLLNSEDY